MSKRRVGVNFLIPVAGGQFKRSRGNNGTCGTSPSRTFAGISMEPIPNMVGTEDPKIAEGRVGHDRCWVARAPG